MPTLAPALRECGYWLHRYRRVWRGTLVIDVVNPLLFLTALGAGLGSLVDANAPASLDDISYLSYLAPGLLAAATMQTVYVETAGPVMVSARRTGNYRAAAATPLDSTDILHGHLLFVVCRGAVTGSLFTAVACVFGALPAARCAPLAAEAALISAAFAAPIAAWAITVTRPARLTALLRFVLMPLYMCSGTFWPVTQLGDWAVPVAHLSPLWHGVELTRATALGTARPGPTLVHVLALAACALTGLALARRTYRRCLHA
ncbi:ABC transporter permease [Streptomyces sp. cg35]|uniref:ABC transporter permease n=1 Tax=Streptomyces sp. cg35 TaxID=3421650 RepID=UPI003D166D0A